MQLVQGLTSDSSQVINLTLPDGTTATLSMSYRPQQLGWFYDLAWNGNNQSFELDGRRVVTSPNMIRQFRNQVDFGLMVTYANNAEPTGQQDWVNGNASMYLLSADDVAQVELDVFPGN